MEAQLEEGPGKARRFGFLWGPISSKCHEQVLGVKSSTKQLVV